MSSEEDNYTESIIEMPEELSLILYNEEFNELSQFLKKCQHEDLTKYKIFLSSSYKSLIRHSHFIQSLDLMMSFPELLEIGLPNDFIINKYFNIVKEGDIKDLEKIISVYGFYPNILSLDNLNLFSEAVYSDQYNMIRYLREELGVECKEEHIMNKAARNGNKDILKYLYEELGIESTNYDILVRNAVESGSLECIKYIHHNMLISKISDYKIIEIAIRLAVINRSIEMLDFLINYFVIEFNPAHIPPYRRNNSKYLSLFSSILIAIQHNDLHMLNYLIHVIKLELFTDNPDSDRNCYLEYLQIAVTKGNFDMLRFLIEDAQLQPGLLPKINQEGLMITICNSKIEIGDKIKLLEYLKKHDQNSDYDILIMKLEREEEEDSDNISDNPYKKMKIEGKNDR